MLRGSKILIQNKCVLRSDFLVRSKHNYEGIKLQPSGQISSKSCFHQPQAVDYPAIEQLPLPLNIEDLASTEKLKFSPQRSRDISSSYISSSSSSFIEDKIRYKTEKSDSLVPVDERIECYDCSGTINLSSAMQTTVPFPFISSGKPIHLNMPGGQWRQNEKYVSEDLNNVHHSNTSRLNSRTGTSFPVTSKTRIKNFYFCIFSEELNNIYNPCSPVSFNKCHFRKFYSTTTDKKDLKENNTKADSKKLSYAEKLKVAVKQYGPVIFIFHISISLMSLGICYLLVSSGVDLTSLAKTFGANEGAGAAGTAAGFVVAYAVHKALAPARIGLTLSLAPFIVKKLRKMGILKNQQSRP